MNTTELSKIENTLNEKLQNLLENTLKEASKIESSNISKQSFHGKIGRWNTIFVDSINSSLLTPRIFINRWIEGLLKEVKKQEENSQKKYNQVLKNTSYHILIKYYKNEIIREYIDTFLERNFYRNYKARIRKKPNQRLWELWFGDKNFHWGLFITPVKREGSWTNDVSEIRRTKFNYWTIEHILETGLVDPENGEIVKFEDVNSILTFYRTILKRISNSQYEKQIFELYSEYISNSQNQLEEPLLIPELRYAGLDKNHLYRLDFTVLNSHTMEMTGFEISPTSSHMSVSKIRGKTQKSVNEDIAKKWVKEINKRNDYFKEFEVPIMTFTDEHLLNLNECFFCIKQKLNSRPKNNRTHRDLMEEINQYSFND